MLRDATAAVQKSGQVWVRTLSAADAAKKARKNNKTSKAMSGVLDSE
jgi:hypothetical protein